MYIKRLSENLKERDHLEDNVKIDKQSVRMWIGFI
jgi:hypothetical protein